MSAYLPKLEGNLLERLFFCYHPRLLLSSELLSRVTQRNFAVNRYCGSFPLRSSDSDLIRFNHPSHYKRIKEFIIRSEKEVSTPKPDCCLKRFCWTYSLIYKNHVENKKVCINANKILQKETASEDIKRFSPDDHIFDLAVICEGGSLRTRGTSELKGISSSEMYSCVAPGRALWAISTISPKQSWSWTVASAGRPEIEPC